MNETVFQNHYGAINSGKPQFWRHDASKSRNVHKLVCGVMARIGPPQINQFAPQTEKTRALNRYRSEVEREARRALNQSYGFFNILTILGPILSALLPLLIQWIMDQMSSGYTASSANSLKTWSES